MFIFEFIKKYWYKTYREPKILEEEKCIKQYDATDDSPDFTEDYETCEHVFMPVDSTGEILACTKCGILANKEDVIKKIYLKEKKFNFKPILILYPNLLLAL